MAGAWESLQVARHGAALNGRTGEECATILEVVQLPATITSVVDSSKLECREREPRSHHPWGGEFARSIRSTWWIPSPTDRDRYKVAKCIQAEPVFCGFGRSTHSKVISVSVLRGNLDESSERVREPHLPRRPAVRAQDVRARDDSSYALGSACCDVKAIETVQELHPARGFGN